MVEGGTQPMPELTIDNSRKYSFSGFSLMVILSTILAFAGSIFFFFYNISLGNQIEDLSGQESALVSEIQTPDNIALEDQINGAASAISQMTTLKGSAKMKVGKFLTDFAGATTKEVKINGLSLDQEGILKIDGVGANQITVAKFVKSLNDAKFLENVVLIDSSLNSQDSKNVISFSISANLISSDLTNASLESGV